MEDLRSFSQKQKNNWISITGYRTLLILKLLLQEGKTLDELVSLLKEDKLIQKTVSKDTVRIVINTLRKIGCEIPRPERSTDYKYRIVSHPFILSLSDNQIKSFLKLRDILCDSYDWEKILLINDLFEKLFSLTKNQEQIDSLVDDKLLGNIDRALLVELSNQKLINRKIIIEYKSVKYGIENLSVIPKKIIYQNGKLYLVCFNFKYSHNSILNIERILKIKNVDLNEIYEDVGVYEVDYKLYGDSLKTFELKENEEIIERNKDSIIIKARVMDEFLFVQRILLFGSDFEIISPDYFKEKLADKLKLLKRGYRNE